MIDSNLDNENYQNLIEGKITPLTILEEALKSKAIQTMQPAIVAAEQEKDLAEIQKQISEIAGNDNASAANTKKCIESPKQSISTADTANTESSFFADFLKIAFVATVIILLSVIAHRLKN